MLNHARWVSDAGLAASKITSPVQNLMTADTAGNIAFYTTGRVPLRRSGDGAWPADGADGQHDWSGWASGTALPHSVNPASGELLNANEPMPLALTFRSSSAATPSATGAPSGSARCWLKASARRRRSSR